MSVLNAFYIDELTQWSEKFNTDQNFQGLTLAGCSGVLSLEALPFLAKRYLKEKYQLNNGSWSSPSNPPRQLIITGQRVEYNLSIMMNIAAESRMVKS